MKICPNLSDPTVKAQWDALSNNPDIGQFEAMREFMEAEINQRAVGTPAQVLNKLERRNRIKTPQEQQAEMDRQRQAILEKTSDTTFADPNSLMGNAILMNPINSKSLTVQDNSKTRAMELARKLSSQLGVGFQIISFNEAVDITKNAKNPYNASRGPAFFYGDTIYFLEGALNTENAFHEFAHPLIRTIQMENPLLFDKLVNQAIAADRSLLADAVAEYADLEKTIEETTDEAAKEELRNKYKKLVAEEVLVKALTKSAMIKNAGQEPSSALAKIVKEILYSIKQFLRRVFGKNIPVSKLDENTTLDQLAEMLVKGGKFEINTEALNEKDVVAYQNELNDYMTDLRKATETLGGQYLTNLSKLMYEGTVSQIRMLVNSKKYHEILDLFVDDYNRGDLQEMRANIAKYAKELEAKAETLIDEVENTRGEIQAVVTNMLRLEKMMGKMETHLGNLLKEAREAIETQQDSQNHKDVVHKAAYYSHVLTYWQKYIKDAKETMRKAGAPARSPMNELLNAIDDNMNKSADYINQINHVGLADVLWDQWKDTAQIAEEKFNNKIELLRKRGASQEVIERAFVEFHGMPEELMAERADLQARKNAGEILRYDDQQKLDSLNRLSLKGLQITPEKIKANLRGEGKDANWANSYLEGYLYNTDPIIGGFAKFYKNNIAEMELRVQARQNEIVDELQPLIKAAGITFDKIGELGQKIGFVDKIGYFDKKTKTFKEKLVWTLLNPYKNYRYEIDKFNHDIRELQNAYNKSGNDVDKKALVDMIDRKKAHVRKYFYNKFTDEYLDGVTLVKDENDYIGKLAEYERDKIFEKMRELQSPQMSEYDVLKTASQMDAYRKQLRWLSSRYNQDGTLKTGDDLAVAERLQEYKERTSKFYEYDERPGVFENTLKNFENETYQKLVDQNYTPGTEEFNDMFDTYRSEWIKRNTRTVIKPEFYAKRAEINARIKALTSKLPSSTMDFSDVFAKIIDLVGGYRDEDGQPIGSNMPDGRRDAVKAAQEEMERARNEWASFSGLTREEMNRLVGYSEIRTRGERLSKSEFDDYIELIEKQKTDGLNKYERAELNGLFAQLNELQRKEPTKYYTESVNYFLDEANSKEVYDLLGATSLDETNMDKLYNPKVIQALSNASPKFAEWFEKNHITKEYYNKETGNMEPSYQRIYVWNVIKPNDPSMYESTTILNDDGTIKEVIPGKPSLNFYYRKVKNSYINDKGEEIPLRTGYDPATGKVNLIVGVHRDNTGRDDGWLPKPIQGSPYINEEYFRLKNADPNSQEGKLFKILEVITKQHLKTQEGLSKRAKLYLDFPRFEKSNLEVLQSKGVKGITSEKTSKIGAMLRGIANFFKGSKAQVGSSFNWEDDAQLVRADAFGDQIDNIPIQGLFNLDLNETSTDIISSMLRYLYAAENHKQLVKINPVAQGLKNILNDPNQHLKDFDKINLANFKNFGMTTYLNKKGKYVRKDAFNNFYEREFLGQVVTGAGSDWKGLQNVQRLLFGRASFSFFALNIPSALKNMFGAKFQSLIHSAAGTDITFESLARGEAWSAKYMMKLSFGDAYKQGQKSLEHQIGEIFDPIQGRFKEKFATSFTRTLLKDSTEAGWLTNFRKWTEIQASMQTFGGMMYKQKVPMGDKMIDYMDAWELRDGKIQLKEGVDPSWGITYDEEGNMIVGEKFKNFRSRVHGVMNKLNGAYAALDQPEAQRYLAFRFVSFLRRYFTSMAMNRFGSKRWNPGYGDIDEGYYITAVKSLWTMMRERSTTSMTPEDKQAWMKFVTEMGTLYVLGMLTGLIWGWDDDDEDRFEKLRQMSGHLPIPGTREADRGEEFDFGGFLSLHMLNQVMQIRAENEQFIPFPSYGLDNVKSVIDLKSLAFGPTIDTWQQLGTDMVDIFSGSDRQFYKRRTGPYEWQDRGGRKVFAHLAKMVGINASNIDPAQMITNTQKAKDLSTKK
jgi:hypothetical protein